MSVNTDIIEFSEAIKYMRNTAGFTQKYLAEILKMPHQTLSSYERGHNKVTMETFYRIATACEFEINMSLRDIDSNKTTSIKMDKIKKK
ncbi:MAG: helix-turn-helix domain-containing protein [Lachnospiraceae bacterium]